MIDELSRYAADFLAERDGLQEDRAKLYQIGVDVVLSTGITFAGIGILAARLGNLDGAVLFLACFITVRSYSGGYHASTRTRCFFLTCAAYLCTFWAAAGLAAAAPHLPGWGLGLVVFLTAAMDVGVFAAFAPVENRHKRLPPDWKARNRKRAWYGLFGWMAAAAAFHTVRPVLSLQIWMTEAVITILILWCKPWRRNI